MTTLSVNLNKVALLRNSRLSGLPSVCHFAEISLAAGAGGVTVHPRPDERHTRPKDVRELSAVVRNFPNAELNIEGNPFSNLLDIVREAIPTQCTLVPDAPDALTSDHGWDLMAENDRLRPIIHEIRSLGIRVSLFLEPDVKQVEAAAEIGADRIELYTAPYAEYYGTQLHEPTLECFIKAGERAQELGLGVNAGHDLNLDNLGVFCTSVPKVLEVSIGHALVSYALEVGFNRAVSEHLKALSGTHSSNVR